MCGLADLSRVSDAEIASEAKYFNEAMASGKWRHHYVA